MQPAPSRTADRLRDTLEQEIVFGELKPNDRLDETLLANRFGVSRTPIREALAQLAAIGLIEIKSRRGAFVKAVTFRDIVEMFEVMAELEALCACLTARRITDSQLADLVEAHESCAAAAASNDTDAYYYENEKFHAHIYAACGNRFLADQTESLRNRLKPYRRLQLRTERRVSSSLNEHAEIVDAIRARDEDRVRDVIKSHILIQGERLNLLFQGLSDEQTVSAAMG